MITFYKKGNQYRKKFGGVYYEFDITQAEDGKKLLKEGWFKTLPETVAKTKKAKADK